MNAIPLSTVLFREDLYPRINHDPALVGIYAENIEQLPPIEINQHNELIDGWHRLTAHRKVNAETIQVTVTQTKSDAAFLLLACKRNASHGKQLSNSDKKSVAVKIYGSVPTSETEDALIEALSVNKRTLSRWLSSYKHDAKAEMDAKIFDLWLRCYTEREIADRCEIPQKTVDRKIESLSHLGHLSKMTQNDANYASDEWFPYNVWTKLLKTNEVSHPGNTEVTFVDRLLWAYTGPLDIVIDPFAGGGSTLDICRKRSRRCLISDLTPIPEREHEIRQHDITSGPLKPPGWNDVKLVYLDPPYWCQQDYEGGPTDLSLMSADEFHHALIKVVNDYANKLSPGTKIALIIQPTQWNAPEHEFTDHIAAVLQSKLHTKLKIIQRIQCPYQSQQANAQMVIWAKENKEWLVLSREMIVWSVL